MIIKNTLPEHAVMGEDNIFDVFGNLRKSN